MEHIIITIGRQLGSGGRVIAQKLAQEFDCQFYDKEILNLAAKAVSQRKSLSKTMSIKVF